MRHAVVLFVAVTLALAASVACGTEVVTQPHPPVLCPPGKPDSGPYVLQWEGGRGCQFMPPHPGFCIGNPTAPLMFVCNNIPHSYEKVEYALEWNAPAAPLTLSYGIYANCSLTQPPSPAQPCPLSGGSCKTFDAVEVATEGTVPADDDLNLCFAIFPKVTEISGGANFTGYPLTNLIVDFKPYAPQPSPQKHSHGHDGDNAFMDFFESLDGKIVIIGGGSVILIAALVIIYCCCCRRKKRAIPSINSTGGEGEFNAFADVDRTYRSRTASLGNRGDGGYQPPIPKRAGAV